MTGDSDSNFSRRSAIGAAGLLAVGALGAGRAAAAGAADKVTIYHVEGRRSQRIIWLCEEIGAPYEVIFKRGDILGSLDMIRTVSPLMTVAPTVVFRGKTMVESGAIIEYLMSQFPGGAKLAPPKSSPDYADYLMWLHFAEGSAMPRLSVRPSATPAVPRTLPNGRVLKFVETSDVVKFIDDYIAAHPYFGGHTFSGADIMMDFLPNIIRLNKFDPKDFSHLLTWQQKIQARPAYQRALKVGLPDGVPPDAPKPKPATPS